MKNNWFFVFSDDGSKKLGAVWAKYISVSARSYSVLSENGIVNRVWSCRLWDIKGRNIKTTAESAKDTKIVYFRMLLMVAQNPVIHGIFWKS